VLHFETERFTLTTKFDMETNVNNTTEPQHDAKLPVSGSLPIAVASIRSNFELWRKGEINDGAFSWHLQNNLLRIEKDLASNDR